MTVGHTPKCDARLAESDKARAEWFGKWPNACKSCEGEGGHMQHNYPSEPDDYDICSCIDGAHCPRCGYDVGLNSELHELFVEGGKKCPSCDWSVEGGADQVAPASYECWGCMPIED